MLCFTLDGALMDTCKGIVSRWVRRSGSINPETGTWESEWIAEQRRCKRKLLDKDYCADHYSQGEYERETEHAYAAHTSVW